MLTYNSEISFERTYQVCKKCTPKQITLYQISLNLHKIVGEMDKFFTFEHVTVITQIASAPRQLNFETFKNNKCKIGMNTTVNKLYHISKLVGLDSLNLGFVHYKKLMKFQFLKFGKT